MDNEARVHLDIEGMGCGHCSHFISELLARKEGVHEQVVDHTHGTAEVRFDNSSLKVDDLIETINSTGTYRVRGYKFN